MATITQSENTAQAPVMLPELLTGKLQANWQHVLACLAVCVFFIYLCNVPLFHTDLWGHVAYGHWILEHGGLPAEDPFVTLAQGVPVIDSAWLGQVTFAAVESLGGAEWISNVYAMVVLATYVLLAWALTVRLGRLPLGMLAAGLVLVLSATRLAIARTEIFGVLCFALLILLTAIAERKPADDRRPFAEPDLTRRLGLLLGVPLLFVVWANMHGSFLVGIAFLGCNLAGRVIEVAWTSRSVRAVLSDRSCRTWLIATELAVAATLLNPYGMDMVINAFAFPSNPNLRDVLEWEPLTLQHSAEGLLFGFSWVLMLVVLRHSPVRMRPRDVLLLAVFNFVLISSVRMMNWYAVVYVYVMAPHLAAVAGRLRLAERLAPLATGEDGERTPVGYVFGKSYVHTATCALLLWCAFALTPVADPVLGGQPTPPEKLYSEMTPRGVSQFLSENPPEGQVWNPQWWGDWLVWDGPEGIQPFMTTNAVHLAPNRVWRDYLGVARANTGWQRILERYAVNTIVVHKELQRRLADEVRLLTGWEIVYEDELAIVLQRQSAGSAEAE